MKKKVVDEEHECLKLEKMKIYLVLRNPEFHPYEEEQGKLYLVPITSYSVLPLLRTNIFDSEGVYSVRSVVISMVDGVFGSRVSVSSSLVGFSWKLRRYGAILFDESGGCKVGGGRWSLAFGSNEKANNEAYAYGDHKRQGLCTL
ncbi:hypothetical protein LR48_Vigan09g160900 [Vigna angularis]|uniref:Uncharacterized protein n=1 Tax=Phaseolus angularis TaxID=3914 RepID=A0A0L9VD32_PHAAN|nr:uncharacterized protein HKW66_Vig0073990 [Vigna angularis]KOM52950.1 hypothetical protein LR48_Vigan09g160900 [Vigna angularis]